jgi:hypothetical protein
MLIAFRSTVAMPKMAQQQTGSSQQLTEPQQQMQREAERASRPATPASPHMWPTRKNRVLLRILPVGPAQPRVRLAGQATPAPRELATSRAKRGTLWQCGNARAESTRPGAVGRRSLFSDRQPGASAGRRTKLVRAAAICQKPPKRRRRALSGLGVRTAAPYTPTQPA